MSGASTFHAAIAWSGSGSGSAWSGRSSPVAGIWFSEVISVLPNVVVARVGRDPALLRGVARPDVFVRSYLAVVGRFVRGIGLVR
ncbi:hypothetical protein BBK14_16450 [Parafrankia soli]|uniref:Uncharacterized protein n=1 Tax=Parafrankia soli TaxID=2599596 RepID=A0A1S1QC02_9ACTN|nr:hypothetical protein BBK14_16450 [Parafrankia soli]